MKEPRPFESMGVAGYVLMMHMLTGMAKAGQGSDALAIIADSDAWLRNDVFSHSSVMRAARKRLEAVRETVLKLAARVPESPTAH